MVAFGPHAPDTNSTRQIVRFVQRAPKNSMNFVRIAGKGAASPLIKKILILTVPGVV